MHTTCCPPPVTQPIELSTRTALLSRPLPGVAADFHMSVLADIYQPETNIAIWQRSPALELQQYAQQLIKVAPHWQMRLITRPAALACQLAKALPLHSGQQALIKDVVLLVDMFSCLFELEHVGVRLAVLNKAMCPKFHVDRIPCRLICTYLGAGTLWHTGEQVDYLENCAVRPKTCAMQKQLSINDVALLKGEAWEEGSSTRGLVHCSPPASLAAPRLVLTLDFA